MNESNEFFRATIIANQTFKQLLKAGHSDADAKRMVVSVINAEEVEMNRHSRAFDEKRFFRRLQKLPDESC